MSIRNFLILGGMALAFSSCIQIENAFIGLPPGPWRAEITLTDSPESTRVLEDEISMGFEEISQGKLPFTFEVKYKSDSLFYLELINGEERIVVDDITMGLDRSTGRDTIQINFPGYETYVKGEFEENEIRGDFVDPTREGDYRLPFRARFGQNHRFTRLRKPPVMDISGTWAVDFEVETDHPYPALGKFSQEGNELTGTFITETGDYRYLEGTIQANKMYLSVFDGAHLFLFEGKIQPDSTIIGSFRSGSHYQCLWEAGRDESASLRDLTEYVKVVDPAPFNLEFEDLEGNPYRVADIDAGVKLVQVMGTWCPNCKDETEFLRSFLKERSDEPITAVAIAFERSPREQALQNLTTYADRMNIPYPILYGGTSDKAQAGEVFPMLSEVLAWPTLLVLDRQNRIRRVYSGFFGPATEEYLQFKTDFTQLTESLLEEYEAS